MRRSALSLHAPFFRQIFVDRLPRSPIASPYSRRSTTLPDGIEYPNSAMIGRFRFMARTFALVLGAWALFSCGQARAGFAAVDLNDSRDVKLNSEDGCGACSCGTQACDSQTLESPSDPADMPGSPGNPSARFMNWSALSSIVMGRGRCSGAGSRGANSGGDTGGHAVGCLPEIVQVSSTEFSSCLNTSIFCRSSSFSSRLFRPPRM